MLADLKMLESIQNTQSISREELGAILQTQDSFLIQELHKKAQQTATQIYGNKIYIRGLIEFTNYCKNNCYYCGIRCANATISSKICCMFVSVREYPIKIMGYSMKMVISFAARYFPLALNIS